MATEEDVPPLEDMSEMLQKAEKFREIKEKSQSKAQKGKPSSHVNGHSSSDKVKVSSVKSGSPPKVESNSAAGDTAKKLSENKQSTSAAKSSSKSSSDFAGLKKGFMFGGSKPPSKSSQSSKQQNSSSTVKEIKNESSDGTGKRTLEDVPFIKKQETADSNSFKFSEVQEAMQNSTSKLMETKDQWVTDDLLSKLEGNTKMLQRLQDPRFMQAITEFQSNPTQAMQKYQNNKEVQEFLQDFCGMMGEHFTKLADKESPPSSNLTSTAVSKPALKTHESGGADLTVHSSTNPNQATHSDEMKMQDILSNPDVQAVLMDPWIQNLFDTLRRDPNEGQKLLHTVDTDKKEKIQKLVNAGLLQFQR